MSKGFEPLLRILSENQIAYRRHRDVGRRVEPSPHSEDQWRCRIDSHTIAAVGGGCETGVIDRAHAHTEALAVSGQVCEPKLDRTGIADAEHALEVAL